MSLIQAEKQDFAWFDCFDAAELLGHIDSPKRFKNASASKKMRNIGKVKPCKVMFFGLNGPYMRAQELNIGGFGTEFRDEAIGIGLRI